MIEAYALTLFLAIIGTPLLIGGILCYLTRPRPYYFKHTERGYRKIKYRRK